MTTAIKAKRLFDKWQKDPEYRKEYEALAPEFERAKTLVAARTRVPLGTSGASGGRDLISRCWAGGGEGGCGEIEFFVGR